MDDFQVKNLLGKLTGIRLAMPMVPGQISLKNRRLVWHRYQPGQLAAIPEMMQTDMHSLITNFRQEYSKYAGGFSDIVFAFYANDSSINEYDMELITNSNEPPEKKAEFARIAKFITDHGVQLWWSPDQMAKYEGSGNKSSINGSELHRKTFGYAWGGKKVIDPEKKNREVQHLNLEKAVEMMDNDKLKADMQTKNQCVVKLITAEKNGRFGIFFTDGAQLFSVLPAAYFDVLKSRLASKGQGYDEQTVADKNILKNLKSGIQKFFIIQSKLHPETKKEQFLPNQKRFILDTPEDINPKPVFGFSPTVEPTNSARSDSPEIKPKEITPAHDGLHLGNTDVNKRYIACLYNDGTMFWQKENDKNVKIPMTEHQVDSFNGWKDSYWIITNPDKFEFKLQTLDQERQYKHDTDIMNQLSDFLQSHSNTERHVASQKFQTIIIGPRFTHSGQVGKEETLGRMSHPDTFVRSLDNESNQFVGKRGDWVTVKKEYNISSLSQLSTMPAQSVSGTGALQGTNSLQKAIDDIHLIYGVPDRVLPQKPEMQAAQQAFDNAQKAYASNNLQQQAPQNIMQNMPSKVNPNLPDTGLSKLPPENVENVENIKEPAFPTQNSLSLAKVNVFTKSVSDILRQIKK